MLRELLHKRLQSVNVYMYLSEGSRDRNVINDFRRRILIGSKGVLHIGAHEGQEANYYKDLGLRVMWVEAIPEKYKILKKRLLTFSEQKCVNALLGSQNQKNIKFFLSSNDSQSSSIYDFGNQVQVKNLIMVDSIELEMKRLDACFTRKIVSNYPHWVVDVQGAELEVLKGAGKLLDNCYSLQVEVTSRDYYRNGAIAQEVIDFLGAKGFVNLQKHKIGYHEDLLFVRVS
jgi:FkbM family methyltransferase